MTTSEREYVETHISGDIAGFPLMLVLDIVERTLDEEDCPDDVVDIMEDLSAERSNCFTWFMSDEGEDFWNNVIRYRDFDLYFERFPSRSVLATQCLNLQTWD
jgi:hypothetical protein